MRHVVRVLILTLIGTMVSSRELPAQGSINSSAWEAIHSEDIRTWATKSGLSVKAIERIVKSIGRGGGLDDEDSDAPYSIQDIDVKSLEKRGQIFVALTGPATGHALAVYVVRARSPYSKIWEVSELFENGSCPGVTFATESLLGEATASVSSRGQIVVRIPTRNTEPNKDGEYTAYLLAATYAWNGKTYVLQSERKFAHYENYKTRGPGVLLKCN